MQIRTMTIQDYDGVYGLWLACSGMGLNDLDDSKGGITRFLVRNPDTCFVAEEDGKIIGTILTGNDGRRGYIYHAAVHPEYRRQGIATQLVETAMAALYKIGITKVALVVFDQNTGGNAFWEKIGFASRTDLIYRNRAMVEVERFDT